MISPAHADIFTPEQFGERERFPLQIFHRILVKGHSITSMHMTPRASKLSLHYTPKSRTELNISKADNFRNEKSPRFLSAGTFYTCNEMSSFTVVKENSFIARFNAELIPP